MKKYLLLVALSLVLFACTESDSKTAKGNGAPSAQEDSLIKDIDEGHVFGMSKIGNLHKLRANIQATIDSIGKLPAKTKAAATPYLDKLKNTINDIDYADNFMDRWMMEFNVDSARENMNERLRYLRDEKLKVDKIKSAISNSLMQADSLLKARF